LNPLYENMKVSVFERMSLAAAKHGAVNLGQGFPDFGWPDEILDEAARALKEGSNQYAPSRGLPQLRQAIADHYDRHFGQSLDPDHICVTSGATEALGAMILATVEPGDEVIIFTPAYDSYALQIIADVAIANDLTIISDEVWEHVLLHGGRFIPIATLPGMASRTLKAGSAGKIFSLTGWKVGWIVASTENAAVAARAHQFLTFATAPNLQAAVAYGMGQDGWIEPMRERFSRALKRMSDGLTEAGFAVLEPASTYFLCVDLQKSGIDASDEEFASLAVERAGVATVPVSAFAEDDPSRHLVRLCFAKRDETIDAGVAAMARARELFV
jgi:N-succinyldiaminopimelate aminotransferase